MGTHDYWVSMKFVFGKPIDEPFDREREIESLLTMIKRRQPVAVIGVRRIGKTSIILKALKEINNPKVYISAEEFVEGKGFDLKSFLSALSSLLLTSVINYLEPHRRISLAVKIKGKELLERLRELVGYVKIKFNINLAELDVLFLNKGLKEGVPQILDLPQRVAEELGIENVVVAIDEFQYLRLASQNFPGLFNLLRSKWQFHSKVSYVISGSSVGLLEKMFSSKVEPFFQFFFPIYVKNFDEDVSLAFLKKGFEDEGKLFEEEALRLATKELDGIPAWLNYFGLKCLECEKVTLHCARKVLEGMYFNDPIIRSIVMGEYNKLGKNAREVLRFLAKKGDLRGIGLSKSSLSEGIKSLLDYGYIVRKERGVYSIVDPIVAKVIYYLDLKV